MTAVAMAGADWELDFYSRPILEADGRKRWELLIISTPTADGREQPFRFSKICPFFGFIKFVMKFSIFRCVRVSCFFLFF